MKKGKPKASEPHPGEAMAAFEQLPEETRKLLDLKQQSARATGPTSVRIQKKIRKRSKPSKDHGR
jgi:hypothetical protein